MKTIFSILFCLSIFSQPTYAEAINGTASYYGLEACRYNPDPKCPTADGTSLYQLIRNNQDFSAGWHWPFGTRLKVCNQSNGKCTRTVIRDRGPAERLQRIIDLSEKNFSEIADKKEGIIKVKVEKL